MPLTMFISGYRIEMLLGGPLTHQHGYEPESMIANDSWGRGKAGVTEKFQPKEKTNSLHVAVD